jgi:hypothetical protein
MRYANQRGGTPFLRRVWKESQLLVAWVQVTRGNRLRLLAGMKVSVSPTPAHISNHLCRSATVAMVSSILLARARGSRGRKNCSPTNFILRKCRPRRQTTRGGSIRGIIQPSPVRNLGLAASRFIFHLTQSVLWQARRAGKSMMKQTEWQYIHGIGDNCLRGS